MGEISRPLSYITREFLEKYKASTEYRHGYNLGNMQFVNPNHFGEKGKRQAIWIQSFADRLFGVQSLDESNELLEPWNRWGKAHKAIWRPYWNGEHGSDDVNTHYKKVRKQFEQIPIPPEISNYQADLTDQDLLSIAGNLIWMTNDMRESIDLFEDASKPVSLKSVYRAQRILDKPVLPVGGFEDEVTQKPDIKRIDHQDKPQIQIKFSDPPEIITSEDPSAVELWMRWNQIQQDLPVSFINRRRNEAVFARNGIVLGYSLLGGGEEFLFAPNIGAMGIVVQDKETGFLRTPLVRDIRLGSEQITEKDLYPEKPHKIEAVFMNPASGGSLTVEFNSEEAALEAINKSITDLVEGNERIEPYNSKISPSQN